MHRSHAAFAMSGRDRIPMRQTEKSGMNILHHFLAESLSYAAACLPDALQAWPASITCNKRLTYLSLWDGSPTSMVNTFLYFQCPYKISFARRAPSN